MLDAARYAAAATLIAHDGPHAAWRMSGWDAAVLASLALGGLLYALGAARLARAGAHVRRVERVSFWAGWTAMIAAVAPPLDRAATLRFSAHMAQHELLMLIGAPLLIVGRPIVPWLWALSVRWRRRIGPSAPARRANAIWAWLTLPVVAWALHGATIWIWHLPALYEAAVRSEALHAVQHATFVATAVCFWWGLVYGRYGRLAYGASALFVFTTSLHTGILGALFTFSGAPFYPLYASRGAAEGIDPLGDQQLAGLYMWIPAGAIFMLFGLALVMAWLSESERRATLGGSP
jgi:putative membrane protein